MFTTDHPVKENEKSKTRWYIIVNVMYLHGI